jgi:hypothetical protein
MFVGEAARIAPEGLDQPPPIILISEVIRSIAALATRSASSPAVAAP